MTPGTAAPRIRSVAVLPLQNLSGDPKQEYFADGMTEALITDLAKVGALKVISRSSTMRFKGSKAPLAEIARELGVDALIEGSAQRSGDQVRITAQLVDPRTHQALWADSCERAFSDVRRLRGEVAQAVARKIGAAVTPEERTRLTQRRQVVPAAHEAYLKGEVHLSRFTPQDIRTALRYFETALEIDPEHVPAHAAIAFVWISFLQAKVMPQHEAGTRAAAAARKALELDDTSSEGHAALAVVRTFCEWDWDGAAAEFRRAITLNPSDAKARMGLASLLTLLKRFEESAEHRQRDTSIRVSIELPAGAPGPSRS